MAILHSCEAEKSLFDLVTVAQPDEQRAASPADVVSWLCADGVTVEVKTDELALSTGNMFVETGRTNGQTSGIAVSRADRWCQQLGKVALFTDTCALRDGVRKLVDWNQARVLNGGDRDGTLGVPVPALECLQAPIAREPLGPGTRVRVHAVTFADGTVAKAAVHAPAVVGLKDEQDKGMGFGKDLGYGELGESYVGALLGELPLARTTVTELADVAYVGRRLGDPDAVPVLYAVWRQDGVLDGVGATGADVWVIEFPGAALIVPVAALKALARRHFAASAGRTHPRRPGADVVCLPLRDWVASTVPGRVVPAGLMFCAGSKLPAGLPAFAAAAPQLTAGQVAA